MLFFVGSPFFININKRVFRGERVENFVYVKLQDAYLAEKGDFTGTWQQIGYQMFTNSNFEYGEGTAASCEAGSDDCKGYPEEEARTTASAFAEINAWYAKNKTALNDCATGSTPWTITTSANGTTGGSVLYNAAVASTDCENLTPSFTKLKTTESN